MRYVGWIPTITGNLSFSSIGQGAYPSPCHRASYIDVESGARYTIVAQRRRTSDSQVILDLFGDIIDHMRNRQGYFNFFSVFVCMPDDDFNTNRGMCYAIAGKRMPNAESIVDSIAKVESLDEFRTKMKELYGILDRSIVAPSSNRLGENESPNGLGNDDGLLKKGLEKDIYTGFCAPVEMRRDGRLTILFGEENGSSLSENGDQADDLASQMFYFLRDITHNHQHHESSSDTIIDIFECSKVENRWKKETQYALYRSVISFRRAGTVSHLIRSLGIIAYARAFQRLHVGQGEMLPNYFSGPAEMSSRSAIDLINSKRKPTIFALIDQTYKYFLPLFIIFLAVLSGVFVMSGGRDERLALPGEYLSAIEAYVSNPIGVVANLLFVSIYVMLLSQKELVTSKRYFYRIIRICSNFNYYTVTFIFAILGLSSSASYLYLVTKWLRAGF